MSAPATIQKWLDDGQPYEVGVQVYHIHGPSAVLKRMFALGATPFNRKRLREEMEKLAHVSAIHVGDTRPLKDTNAPQLKPAPPEVKALIDERIRGFREAQHLHAQLELLPADARRLQAATRIRDLMDRNEEIWAALAHYEAHGTLPATVPPVDPATVPPLPQDAAEQVKRRNTLRTYISSQRGTPERRALWLAELRALEEAIGT